ncbi:hypothetical protein D3C76_1114550 [compost metagenome]
MQAPVERQDQRHRMFGHGVGRVGGHPHHGQAQAFGGGQVDMVVTGRAQGDQARAGRRQAFQYASAEVVVDESADHFMAGGQRCGVCGQACGLEVQLKPRHGCGAGEAVLVVGLAAEKQYAHGIFLKALPESLTKGQGSRLAPGQPGFRRSSAPGP